MVGAVLFVVLWVGGGIIASIVLIGQEPQCAEEDPCDRGLGVLLLIVGFPIFLCMFGFGALLYGVGKLFEPVPASPCEVDRFEVDMKKMPPVQRLSAVPGNWRPVSVEEGEKAWKEKKKVRKQGLYNDDA